jgi:hypothetical protein
MPDVDFWDYSTRIVRVFPDYAKTVIWFGGPFSYPETGLSDALIERMKAWEDSYYAALTDDLKWRSVEESERFDAEGMELAHELAVEIGPDFEVEYRSFATAVVTTQLSGRGSASNPAAQQAFSARAEMSRAERATAQAQRSAATDLRWYAQGSSGEVFRPH